MALLETPLCDFGWRGPDFELPDTDGRLMTRAEIDGAKGTLLVFMCNHCPYVQAIAERLAADARALQALGVGVAAIMPNDAARYPEDAPAKMKEYKAAWGLPFPYLYDADQSVARGYGAVCTPDFFGFDAEGGLQYRGRIDDAPMKPEAATRRELLEAMTAVVETGRGPEAQKPSMGCSIKWRD